MMVFIFILIKTKLTPESLSVTVTNYFQTCLARLQSEFNSSQLRLKKRLTALERNITTATAGSGFLSDGDGSESVSGCDFVRSEINIRL